MLFCIQINFNGRQFYKEISKFGYVKKLEKSQNKVGVAEEISCSSKKLNDDLVFKNQVPGWMDGSKSHFKDCSQQSETKNFTYFEILSFIMESSHVELANKDMGGAVHKLRNTI